MRPILRLWVLLGLVVLIISGWFLILLLWTSNSNITTLKDSAAAIQSIVTIGAIYLGAYWFIFRGRNRPKIDITQEVKEVRLTPQKKLFRVIITIRNLGEIRFYLYNGITRLQKITPLEDETLLNAVSRGETPISAGYTSINWPYPGGNSTDNFKRELKVDYGLKWIEPGEVAQIPVDFIVSSEVETVSIYTHLRNNKNTAGWECDTIYTSPNIPPTGRTP